MNILYLNLLTHGYAYKIINNFSGSNEHLILIISYFTLETIKISNVNIISTKGVKSKI